MKSAKSNVSLVDVAKLAGCTAASVSLVLNNSPLPSSKMRERVKRAAAQLGYVPNRMAQSLKRGRTFTLGVVMAYCTDSFASELLDALSAEAAEFGFQLEIHFHRWSVGEEERALKMLGESRAEGIFLSGARSDYKEVAILESLRKQRIPVIGIARQEMSAFASSLVVDRIGGAASLGQYLAELGHRKIDFLQVIGSREAVESTPQDIQLVLDSLRAGAQQRAGDAEIGFFKPKIANLLKRHDIEQFGLSAKSFSDATDEYIEDYLESRSPATAVVATSIGLAWRLLGALALRKRRCPEDISVSCISVERAGALGAVPLTAAEFSVEFMARKGVALMLAAIAGRTVPAMVKIPTRLTARSSTTRPPEDFVAPSS